MKTKYLYLGLILFFNSCSSTSKAGLRNSNNQHVSKLISNLSWNSIEIATNYGTSLEIIDKDILQLEKMGKSISLKLLEEFKNDDKSVIIHLILTNIWEPEVNFLKVSHSEIPKSDEVMIEYRVNNLSWYQSSEKNSKFSIDRVERDKIYHYWFNRVK